MGYQQAGSGHVQISHEWPRVERCGWSNFNLLFLSFWSGGQCVGEGRVETREDKGELTEGWAAKDRDEGVEHGRLIPGFPPKDRSGATGPCARGMMGIPVMGRWPGGGCYSSSRVDWPGRVHRLKLRLARARHLNCSPVAGSQAAEEESCLLLVLVSCFLFVLTNERLLRPGRESHNNGGVCVLLGGTVLLW